MQFRNDPRFRDIIPALFVFVGFSLATIAGTTLVHLGRQAQRNAQFEQTVTQAYGSINNIMNKYATLLEAGRAFAQSARNLDATTFREFTRSLSLREKYPGFQELGYAERIDFKGIADFEEAMRTKGAANYRISTSSTSGDVYPIKFLEPEDAANLRALGFDMFADAVRRAAMIRARDSAGVSATAALTLRQDSHETASPGFLMYVPVYGRDLPQDDELARRNAIQGFMYGAFRTQDLFASLQGLFKDLGILVEVTDPGAGSDGVVFASGVMTLPGNSVSKPYSFAGHTWNITYAPAQQSRYWLSVSNIELLLVPISGMLAAVLLSWFVYRENRASREALAASLAREEAEVSLRVQTQLIEVAREPILVLDGDGRVLTWNVGCEELYKYSREEAIGKRSFELLKTVFPMAREKFWEQLLKEGRASTELTHFTKDGHPVFVEARMETFSTPAGLRILKSDWDIGDRKQAERQQNLLVRELTHRVKNLLAVVQSIVNNTIPAKPETDRMKRVLVARLHALARAQDIVTRANEQGADLLETIRSQFEGLDERINIEGVSVAANASFVQMLALVIHELATNASKHGALSTPDGRVDIGLAVLQDTDGEDVLLLTWRESGGPPVSPPIGRGFGSRLIMTALPGKRGQRPQVEFAPDGLSYSATVPMSAVRPH